MAIVNKYTAGGITFNHSADIRPQDRDFHIHTHTTYELFFFLSGKASYLVEGNIYELLPNTLLLMRSSESHKLIVNGSEPYERYTVNFIPKTLLGKGLDAALLAPFTDRNLGEKNIYYPEDFPYVQPMDMVLKMYRECARLPMENVLYHNLCSILCAVAAAFAQYPKERVPADTRNLDRELLGYINSRLTGALSVESICRYVHLSPAQLNRRFKTLTGTTVYQYIVSKRLILAQRLIANGKTAVAAAQESGFGDYSCFYRMYKKRFGCSPNETGKSR